MLGERVMALGFMCLEERLVMGQGLSDVWASDIGVARLEY
jgi:hypothetical protein